jgi:adenine-specific DNA-methyltransferase
MEQFSSNSLEFNTSLSKLVRQENGIFFTPKNARDRLFDCLRSKNIRPKTILEPSFGSGEFLEDAYKIYPSATVFGVEKNTAMFNSVKQTGRLFNMDFLDYNADRVDLIIGNPPYFPVKIKKPECMVGRGNIYILFLYKCLTEHLKEDGILAFVLPTSLYNSGYYEPCRKYIATNTTIVHLEELDVSYYDTTQRTILLVIKNCVSVRKPYIFKKNTNVYITPFYKELKQLTKSATNLQSMGFGVKTGEVVWNQEKDKLADDGDLIIYTTNIVDKKIVLNNLNKNKKQYIRGFKNDPMVGPAILVSRGYGNLYRFSYAVIKEEIAFHGENHINVIYPVTPEAKGHIEIVRKSFDNPKTTQFIKYFIGNGAISKTEIETILPIWIESD